MYSDLMEYDKKLHMKLKKTNLMPVINLFNYDDLKMILQNLHVSRKDMNKKKYEFIHRKFETHQERKMYCMFLNAGDVYESTFYSYGDVLFIEFDDIDDCSETDVRIMKILRKLTDA